MSNSGQALRQEAIRRRLGGESRKAISMALNHATSWFDKWWSEYRKLARAGAGIQEEIGQRRDKFNSLEVEPLGGRRNEPG